MFPTCVLFIQDAAAEAKKRVGCHIHRHHPRLRCAECAHLREELYKSAKEELDAYFTLCGSNYVSATRPWRGYVAECHCREAPEDMPYRDIATNTRPTNKGDTTPSSNATSPGANASDDESSGVPLNTLSSQQLETNSTAVGYAKAALQLIYSACFRATVELTFPDYVDVDALTFEEDGNAGGQEDVCMETA